MIHIPRRTACPSIQTSKQTDKIVEQELGTYALYMEESAPNFQEGEPVPAVRRGECPVREPIRLEERQGEEQFAMIPTRVEEKTGNTN